MKTLIKTVKKTFTKLNYFAFRIKVSKIVAYWNKPVIFNIFSRARWKKLLAAFSRKNLEKFVDLGTNFRKTMNKFPKFLF